MKQANIYNRNLLAGILTEDENGYTFQYDAGYLHAKTKRKRFLRSLLE